MDITEKKLDDVKALMVGNKIRYLWADCVRVNQEDASEKSVEVPKMYEYYQSAKKCYILMDTGEVWSPQEIVDSRGMRTKRVPVTFFQPSHLYHESAEIVRTSLRHSWCVQQPTRPR